MHVPVLLHEVLANLRIRDNAFIIDGTVDGGGHAQAILERIGEQGKFLGVDWDATLLHSTEAALGTDRRAQFVHSNYAEIPSVLAQLNLPKADGLLLDLGFSSEQLETSGRGFSFLRDEPLLMTYDDDRDPAWKVIRELSETDLASVIYRLSGERFSRRIARAIKAASRTKRIETSRELAEIVRRAVPGNYEMRRINPATRTFQALRMHVNDELGNIERILAALPDVLAPGGRAVIITFHSGEDGIVKKAFKQHAEEGRGRIITKKPIVPSREEILTNPRSRSAKLRTLEII